VQVFQRVDTPDEHDRRLRGFPARLREVGRVDAVVHGPDASRFRAAVELPPAVVAAMRSQDVRNPVRGGGETPGEAHRDHLDCLRHALPAQAVVPLAQVDPVLGQHDGGAVGPFAREADEGAHAVHGQVAHVRAHRRMGQRAQLVLDAFGGGNRVAQRQPAGAQPRLVPGPGQQVDRAVARHGAGEVACLRELMQPAQRREESIGAAPLPVPVQRLKHPGEQCLVRHAEGHRRHAVPVTPWPPQRNVDHAGQVGGGRPGTSFRAVHGQGHRREGVLGHALDQLVAPEADTPGMEGVAALADQRDPQRSGRRGRRNGCGEPGDHGGGRVEAGGRDGHDWGLARKVTVLPVASPSREIESEPYCCALSGEPRSAGVAGRVARPVMNSAVSAAGV